MTVGKRIFDKLAPFEAEIWPQVHPLGHASTLGAPEPGAAPMAFVAHPRNVGVRGCKRKGGDGGEEGRGQGKIF